MRLSEVMVRCPHCGGAFPIEKFINWMPQYVECPKCGGDADIDLLEVVTE